MIVFLINLIHVLSSLYSVVILLRIFLEMLMGPYHSAVLLLRRLTEPVLAPIRRYVPPLRTGGVAWDLSPVIALLLLWLIEQFLTRLLLAIAY